MATWTATQGAALLRPSGNTLHLFFIVGGPAVLQHYGPHPQLIMVNATTIRPGIPHDTGCVLAPGDHPFITAPSYVAYRHTMIDPESHVLQMVTQNLWPPNTSCSDALLNRLIAGICASRLARKEVKLLFNCP